MKKIYAKPIVINNDEYDTILAACKDYELNYYCVTRAIREKLSIYRIKECNHYFEINYDVFPTLLTEWKYE